MKIKDLRKHLPKTITETVKEFLEKLPKDEVVTNEDIARETGLAESSIRKRLVDILSENKAYDRVKVRTLGNFRNVYGKKEAIGKVRELIKLGKY